MISDATAWRRGISRWPLTRIILLFLRMPRAGPVEPHASVLSLKFRQQIELRFPVPEGRNVYSSRSQKLLP